MSAKSVINYSAVVKMVVASALNQEGEPIYPRTWNSDFIGMPIIHKETQHRPTFQAAQVSAIVSGVSERYQVLFALFASTGLRAGEMLALKAEDLSLDCRVLLVQRAIWHGRIQTPKTGNAIRTVDIPNALASLLRVYVAGKTGFLFTTKAGRPLNQRNVLRTLHAVAGKTGFHAFRRFRTSILRKAGRQRI